MFSNRKIAESWHPPNQVDGWEAFLLAGKHKKKVALLINFCSFVLHRDGVLCISSF